MYDMVLLHKVQKQRKLVYGNEGKNSGYFKQKN